ncbi:fad binding domain-containing protein [Curvularia clavata]|uniref:Fad binding domain-containing protein n=1 Tax=Curvularia clavata TaxID=95742 RepID=A0A9Q8Z9M5_CURCL|nr:fad binding domain-containing protein [Curvularia clavata]
MKPFVLIAALAAGVQANNRFEPQNFDANEALMNKGVNVSNPSTGISNNCHIACDTLRRRFGNNKLVLPSDAAYKNFTDSYWSAQQRSISPGCVFKPETAQDVSVAVLTSRLTNCPFAAKSGGHSAVPGGSNIQNGITISFEKMSKTTVSADRKSVTFEPGQTWRDVYSKLAKDNIIIIGGRAASVGVGGLTLGGGISYFSNTYGLACDNVISYEVVTACGRIINVSKTSYPDLYWALRGGGNNFGIVTKFQVNAISKSPMMWGGMRLYSQQAIPALIQGYYNLGFNASKDGKAHQILSFAYGGPQIGSVASLELEYADPNGETAPVLKELNSIDPRTVLQGGFQNSTLVDLTVSLGQTAAVAGLRQSFITWTAKLDVELANITQGIFFEELPSVIDAANITPALALQVISEPIIRKTALNGGNPLGLYPEEGPLMLALVSIRWSNSTDDARINAFSQRVLERSVQAAKALGKSSDYIYMNYANGAQDVVAGYGAQNKARLEQISKKYDPEGVFERLQPGYFKLNKAPDA